MWLVNESSALFCPAQSAETRSEGKKLAIRPTATLGMLRPASEAGASALTPTQKGGERAPQK